MHTAKNWRRLLCICLLSLLLFTEAVVPASAAQEPVAYLQASYTNPLCGNSQTAVTRGTVKSAVCRDSVQEAAKDLLQGMKNRETTIYVTFLAPDCQREQLDMLLEEALVHNGDPAGGDYLYKHLAGWSASATAWLQNGEYRIEATCNMRYLSTAAQEKAVDKAVKGLLDQLNVYHADDYQKVSAIYDYMCANIQYDYAGLEANTELCHTAYAALINGKSVCQGYASLFYRLAMELGVDTRVVSGFSSGERHAWNIVKLDGVYYNLDATWDAGYGSREFFLKCDANFPNHTRESKYATESFYRTYPMSPRDYTPGQGALPGDLDGRNGVTEDDAIYLLQYVLMPDLFPIEQYADYDNNNVVDEDDAIYLLQHVLMPELFPIT